jgi:hypothetical protein
MRWQAMRNLTMNGSCAGQQPAIQQYILHKCWLMITTSARRLTHPRSEGLGGACTAWTLAIASLRAGRSQPHPTRRVGAGGAGPSVVIGARTHLAPSPAAWVVTAGLGLAAASAGAGAATGKELARGGWGGGAIEGVSPVTGAQPAGSDAPLKAVTPATAPPPAAMSALPLGGG